MPSLLHTHTITTPQRSEHSLSSSRPIHRPNQHPHQYFLQRDHQIRPHHAYTEYGNSYPFRHPRLLPSRPQVPRTPSILAPRASPCLSGQRAHAALLLTARHPRLLCRYFGRHVLVRPVRFSAGTEAPDCVGRSRCNIVCYRAGFEDGRSCLV